jgi:hypothetical protein
MCSLSHYVARFLLLRKRTWDTHSQAHGLWAGPFRSLLVLPTLASLSGNYELISPSFWDCPVCPPSPTHKFLGSGFLC